MSDPKKPKRGRPSIPIHRKKVKPNITIDPQLLDAARERAELLEITFSEFVTKALESAVEESRNRIPNIKELGDYEGAGKTILNFVTFPDIPLLHAAAGSPVASDGDTYSPSHEIPAGRFAVKIHGSSMEPTYRDGSVVILWDKTALQRPVLKQKFIYLFDINGQKTLKVYDSRNATQDEVNDGLAYTGSGQKPKVHILRSINPDFTEIVLRPEDEIEWLGWLDPKDNPTV